jgi:hypothetical protein
LPICYKCKEEGHMAAECVGVDAKAGELEMFDLPSRSKPFIVFKFLMLMKFPRLLASFSCFKEMLM